MLVKKDGGQGIAMLAIYKLRLCPHAMNLGQANYLNRKYSKRVMTSLYLL